MKTSPQIISLSSFLSASIAYSHRRAEINGVPHRPNVNFLTQHDANS